MITLLTCTVMSAYAQPKSWEIRRAVGYYSKGDYQAALPTLKEAVYFSPNDAELNRKVGVSHLNSADKAASLQYLEQAYKLNPNLHTDLEYDLGQAYQYNLKFDEAKKHYQAYKSKGKDSELLAKTDRKIAECNNGAELIKEPVAATIKNIGSTINSPYPDYAPVISADESVLIFTSRRPGSTGGKQTSDGVFFEDLYSSTGNGSGDGWSSPQNIGELNTSTHDACIALSPDGSQLFIYTDDNNGDVLVSDLKGRSWSKPQSLSKNINSKYSELSVSVSADGGTLYFSSDRPGGYGGFDIYMSRLDSRGKWGEAVNLGPTINTSFDDDAPFMHPSGVLYFSSRGHKGLGGYDIYKSINTGGVWEEPENIGYPINGPDDDIYFVLSANNKHGYYASGKAGGNGGKDIYIISMPPPKKVAAGIAKVVKADIKVREPRPVEITQVVKADNPITMLKGTVIDEKTRSPLGGSTVQVVDNATGEVILNKETNSETGEFMVILPSGKNYGVYAEYKSYLPYSENFDIPNSRDYNEVTKVFPLSRKEFILKNVFFDVDKWNIRADAEPELKRVIKIMQDNPTMKVEIGGHTDSDGAEAYNQKLSENRAKSVVDYIVSNGGIDKSRMTWKGYGESEPIDTNETKEGKQNNRRTVFRVTDE